MDSYLPVQSLVSFGSGFVHFHVCENSKNGSTLAVKQGRRSLQEESAPSPSFGSIDLAPSDAAFPKKSKKPPS